MDAASTVIAAIKKTSHVISDNYMSLPEETRENIICERATMHYKSLLSSAEVMTILANTRLHAEDIAVFIVAHAMSLETDEIISDSFSLHCKNFLQEVCTHSHEDDDPAPSFSIIADQEV